ncbi:hypothetical protein AB5J62_03545 [Amycolatopsis sp. cg5]|uniref:hypothetical protein n=1 Tax=Amycolatopsis sp. cg5 TaxID=3238802 RepID=UPI003524085A
MECGTRAFLGAVFSSTANGETTLATRLLDKLTPGVLLLGDRNFYTWPLWHAAATTGADLLWRATSNANLPSDQTCPDGSYLSRFPNRKHYRHQPDPRPVRVITGRVMTTV